MKDYATIQDAIGGGEGDLCFSCRNCKRHDLGCSANRHMGCDKFELRKEKQPDKEKDCAKCYSTGLGCVARKGTGYCKHWNWKEEQPDKRCGTCRFSNEFGGCRLLGEPYTYCRGSIYQHWRPKEEKVEEWHGFRKGERVEVEIEAIGDRWCGTVDSGTGDQIGVRLVGGTVKTCHYTHVTRLPVEHKFKVGDPVRTPGGLRGVVSNTDALSNGDILVDTGHPTVQTRCHPGKLEPA